MSALARLISALSSRLDRNGQSRASRAIASSPASPCAARYASSACPSPYQPGRLIRACDQANVHGIARSESIVGRLVAPAARGRPRPEPQVGQLADRRDVAEERGEPGIVVDERPVGGPRRRGQLVHDRRAGDERALESGVVLRRRGEQDRAGHLLEVAASDGRVGVVGGDDLALLGQLEPRVHGPGRLAEDRPVGRAAAAAEGAAAAVEQRQLDAALAGDAGERAPGPGGASRPPTRAPIPCSNRSSRA